MSTEKRIAANRRNAQLSTGPKTPVGRAKASMNALRHGVLAQRMLLPGEDPTELAELEARICVAVAPEGQLEEALAERVVACVWRLRRVYGIETSLLASEMHDTRRSRGSMAGLRTLTDTTERMLSDLGFAFVCDANTANAISKLSRYEVSLDRSMYRALHELQRLQAERGARSSAPAAVDVGVDVLVRDELNRGDR